MFQLHYIPKKISKIESGDKRVAIVGRVHSVGKGKNSDSFILEDESGKIEIFTENLKNLEDLELNEGIVVRVFCTIDGDMLEADVVQSLKDSDMELFKKVEELYNKAGL